MKRISQISENNMLNRIVIAIILISVFVSISELLFYSRSGSPFLFSQIPKFDGHQFFDLYIWSANLADCTIPIKDITPSRHCGIQYYIFGQPKYPLYLLRILGLRSQFHNLYGFLIGVTPILTFCTLIIQTTRKLQCRKPLLLTIPVVLLSFQFQYALERGQTDLFIASLYLATCLLFSVIRKRARNGLVLILLIVLFATFATITKLYSFSVLLSLSLLSGLTVLKSFNTTQTPRNKQPQQLSQSLKLTLFLSAITTFLAIILYDSYSYIQTASFKGLGDGGFGLTVLADAPYTNDPSLTISSKIAVMITSLFVIVISSAIDKFSFRTPLSPALSLPDIYSINKITSLQLLSILSIITICPIYLVTESFPYKFIFIPLALPGLVETSLLIKNSLPHTSESINLICFLIALSLYLPYFPYSSSISQHLEWFVHFFLHPSIIGGLSGSIFCILRSTDTKLTSS